MTTIYRKSDRVRVKIDGVTFSLAPLSAHQKAEIQAAMLNGRRNMDIKEATQGVVLALKYSIKDVDGVFNTDGTPYRLQLDENKCLSEECVDDLLNLEITEKLSLVCSSLIRKIPDEFTNEKGEKMEGVEIVKTPKADEVKNV